MRLVLVDAPEFRSRSEGKNLVTVTCINKNAEVDSDDNQDRSPGRIASLLNYVGSNVDAEILDNVFASIYESFCPVLSLVTPIEIGEVAVNCCRPNSNSDL